MDASVTLDVLFKILAPICGIFLLLFFKLEKKVDKIAEKQDSIFQYLLNNKIMIDRREKTRA